MKKTLLAAAFALLATSANAHYYEHYSCGPHKISSLIGKYFRPDADGSCEVKGWCDGESHFLDTKNGKEVVVDKLIRRKGDDLFYKEFKCEMIDDDEAPSTTETFILPEPQQPLPPHECKVSTGWAEWTCVGGYQNRE